MSDKHAERQETTIGFWRRLALAIDQMGESYEEQLEKRVCRLEVEVSRLLLIQGEAGASGSARRDMNPPFALPLHPESEKSVAAQ